MAVIRFITECECGKTLVNKEPPCSECVRRRIREAEHRRRKTKKGAADGR